jgi:hypothetical protein
MKRDTVMSQRSMSFVCAGSFAIAAALTLADYGDNPRDWLFLSVTTGGAVICLIRGLLARR